MAACTSFVAGLTRKKTLRSDMMTTNLRRCLTTLDLILMGIGYMVGTGIFVLSGEVARLEAGPSVIISYMLAGVAAALSAACYAEFASFVPLSGSSYTYSYVVVGEIWAFLVGWNVMLESVIGTSSAGKSFSGTLDSLCNHSISRAIQEKMSMGGSLYLNPYPDFMALVAVLLVMVFVLIGAKSSANFNKVMVVIKLLVIAIIIVAGFTLADLSNWTDPDKGGFFPYGAAGTLSGAATCFFAYVGFESLATATEEAKTPRKSLPVAIIGSLVIVTTLYVLSAMALTLMVPYTDIDPLSAFTSAFLQRGSVWAVYVVGVGTLFGLASVMMSGLFAVPRILYAMANDGLIFSFLGRVHPKTQTPIIAILLTGFLASVIALVFDLNTLVELLSIGTLFCFTFVAASIIIIRYNEPLIQFDTTPDGALVVDDITEVAPLTARTEQTTKYTSNISLSEEDISKPTKYSNRSRFMFIALIRTKLETFDKSKLVLRSLMLLILGIFSFLLLLLFAFNYVTSGSWWAILLLVLTSIAMVLPLMLIGCLEQCPKKDYFQVPLVPLAPAFSIFCNIGLMLMLDWMTWVRLLVWIILGLMLYFGYGIRHSKESQSGASSYSELGPTGKQMD